MRRYCPTICLNAKLLLRKWSIEVLDFNSTHDSSTTKLPRYMIWILDYHIKLVRFCFDFSVALFLYHNSEPSLSSFGIYWCLCKNARFRSKILLIPRHYFKLPRFLSWFRLAASDLSISDNKIHFFYSVARTAITPIHIGCP